MGKGGFPPLGQCGEGGEQQTLLKPPPHNPVCRGPSHWPTPFQRSPWNHGTCFILTLGVSGARALGWGAGR